jgi:preprotein translocase subunit SecA
MIVRMGTANEVDDEGNELPLSMKMMSNFIESAQRRVEGMNYDSRKHVVEYDEVLRRQREVIYKQRNDILVLDEMEPVVKKMMASVTNRHVSKYVQYDKKNPIVDAEQLQKNFLQLFFNLQEFEEDEFAQLDLEAAKAKVLDRFYQNLEDKKNMIPHEMYVEFMKVILLRIVDKFWMDHIDQMSSLRQSIGLKSYAQLNPLREYREIGFQMFDEMICNIEDNVTVNINRAQIRDNLEREQVAKPTGTSGGSDEPVKKKPVTVGQKVGRNDPCPCGSGKKYKQCCGK